MSTSAIILIILGVVVLVVLIAGFTIGWSALKDYINPSNNLKVIQHECSTLCTTGDAYSYCAVERTVEIKDQKDITKTCNEFETAIDGKGNSLGIDECLQINCKDYKIEAADNKEDAILWCRKIGNINKYKEENQVKTLTCKKEHLAQSLTDVEKRCTVLLSEEKLDLGDKFDISFVDNKVTNIFSCERPEPVVVN